MRDQRTLDFYDREAEAYAARQRVSVEMEPFLANVPAGGRILELGCGGGHDSQAFIAAGFDVVSTDGSPEMANQAELLLGRPVKVLLFDDIEFISEFNGVWAKACLLHVPKPDLFTIFKNIHRALRPAGALYASFKTGGEARVDQFGRYYNYPDRSYLFQALRPDQWSSIKITRRKEAGYFNTPSDWLHVQAIKA